MELSDMKSVLMSIARELETGRAVVAYHTAKVAFDRVVRAEREKETENKTETENKNTQ